MYSILLLFCVEIGEFGLFAALPYGLQFISKPVSRYGNRYNLQWTVSSYSALVNFTLNVKQVSVDSLHCQLTDGLWTLKRLKLLQRRAVFVLLSF